MKPESIFSPAVGFKPRIQSFIVEKSKAVGKNRRGKIVFIPQNNFKEYDRTKTSEQLLRHFDDEDRRVI